MKKLFTSLVTARPPREIPGKASDVALMQELSSRKPTIKVPQEDNSLGERARDMLLYDAAITPSDMRGAYGIPSWALDAARVIRVSRLCKDALPVYDGSPNEDFGKEVGPHLQKLHGPALQAAYSRLDALLGRNFFGDRRSYQELDSVDWTNWDEVVGWARELAEAQEQQGHTPPPPPKGNPGEGDDEGKGGDQPDDSWLDDNDDSSDDSEDKPEKGSAEEQEKKQLEKSLMPNPETGKMPRISRFDPDPWSKGKLPKPKDGSARPGTLENEEKPDQLAMEMRKYKRGFRRRPEMEGSFPRSFHRIMTDGKIYRGAKIKGGLKGRGTILVDMSGSMSWSEASFNEMLTVLPECTVYGYSGYAGGSKGRMVVLADRGRSAKMEAISQWRYGKGSNIIDDSCLRFLAKCPKPRIWISDGGVTGVGDRQTPYIVALCNEAIVRGNIIRVPNAREAVKAMKA
ncbi:MAG TPA: hypothetical protein VIY48_12265 [Candidatus Paceibacterota bacterium]